jgi:hypothetical protein
VGTGQDSPATLSDAQRLSSWGKLRQIVQKHTAFHDADWALPPAEVKRLESIRDRFAPQDEVQIAEPLFSDPEITYENLELPYEEREALLSRRRQEAVKRVWNAGGLPAVLILVRKVRNSSLVGIALAEAKGGEPQAQIIPDLLCSSEPQIRGLCIWIYGDAYRCRSGFGGEVSKCRLVSGTSCCICVPHAFRFTHVGLGGSCGL